MKKKIQNEIYEEISQRTKREKMYIYCRGKGRGRDLKSRDLYSVTMVTWKHLN